MSKSDNQTNPGELRGDNVITLHTHQGAALFAGRDKTKEKPAIYGVPRFAGSVTQAYFDAMADDPWADWILLKVDTAIDHARDRFEEIRKEVKAAYPKNRSIKIGNQHSVKPATRPLDFKIPSYPHRMAYLVVDADYLILEILSLFHNGCMTRQQKERLTNMVGRATRAALQCATGYRHLGVTRNDVRANNPKARKAKELMGEVPEDILNMKLRSDYAPELRQYEEGAATSEESQPALKVAEG
jgi:integrating conjugative element protein (TIGR03761 family)